MEEFSISFWPTAYSTGQGERVDASIQTIDDMVKLIWPPEKQQVKEHQKTMTRVRKRSRKAGDTATKGGYLLTLDFDDVVEEPSDISNLLKEHEINHIIFTTFNHKVIDEKHTGLNRFKVILPFTVPKSHVSKLTAALGHLVGKKTNNVDDISLNIFFGGVHPDHENDAEIHVYSGGKDKIDTIAYLDSIEVPKPLKTLQENHVYEDDEEMFRHYEKTIGQNYKLSDIKEALDDIDGQGIGDFGRRDVWLHLCLALKSTHDEEVFEIFDKWCREIYSPTDSYGEGENRKIWDSDESERTSDELLSLGTLWHLRKLNLEKREREKIDETDYDFFSDFSLEPQEEIKFLIKDLIVEKSIGFIAGPGGIGKSTFILETAKSISSGENLLGHPQFPTTQGTVVIINKEDRRSKVKTQFTRMIELEVKKIIEKKNEFADFEKDAVITEISKKKLKELNQKGKNICRPSWADNPFIHLTNGEKEDKEGIKFVIESLKKLQANLEKSNRPPISLIIFDPLNMWHGGDQNSQKDMTQIFSAFQKIQKEIDTAIIIVHHMNKSSGYSGSHTIRDSGRFMFYLRPARVHPSVDSEKYLELYVEKSNDARSGYKAFYLKRLEDGLFDLVSIDEIQEEVDVLVEEQTVNKIINKLKEKDIEARIKEERNEGETLKKKAKKSIETKKIKDQELLEDDDALRIEVEKALRKRRIKEELEAES